MYIIWIYIYIYNNIYSNVYVYIIYMYTVYAKKVILERERGIERVHLE